MIRAAWIVLLAALFFASGYTFGLRWTGISGMLIMASVAAGLYHYRAAKTAAWGITAFAGLYMAGYGLADEDPAWELVAVTALVGAAALARMDVLDHRAKRTAERSSNNGGTM